MLSDLKIGYLISIGFGELFCWKLCARICWVVVVNKSYRVAPFANSNSKCILLFANGAASGFTADVLISFFVFWLFMVQRKDAGPHPLGLR